MSAASRFTSLALWRAAAKANPCSHCGAQPGRPCRANAGKGPELALFVHPIRAQRPTTKDQP